MPCTRARARCAADALAERAVAAAMSAGARSAAAAATEQSFSLAIGGPLYRLLRAANLSGSDLELLARRLAIVLLITWLPLLVLSALEGTAWSGTDVPFLRDVDTQVRFLVTLPLLLIAEAVLHQRCRSSLAKFEDRGLIPAAEREGFTEAIASAKLLLDARWIEALLALVCGVAITGVWRYLPTIRSETWYGVFSDGRLRPTAAGWWCGTISLALFWFLLLRWYFRVFVWWRFLARVSRLHLNLLPLHPDHAGGLGFLPQLCLSFMPFLIALGTQMAGWIGNQIVYAGAELPDFRAELAVVTAIAVGLIVGPLLMFVPRLSDARNAALGAYGKLGARYASDFERKWLHGETQANEALIGSSDIQSLADLGNSYTALKAMRIVPLDVSTVIALAGAVLGPCALLVPTWLSFEEFISRLLKMML